MAHAFDRFLESYQNSDIYPCNLSQSSVFPHVLQDFQSRLAAQRRRLFREDGQSTLEICEWLPGHTRPRQIELKDSQALENALLTPQDGSLKDPPSRMFFIRPPHSLERLNISFEMFVRLMTFFQITPYLLNIVFPFGRQLTSLDTHYAGCHFQIASASSNSLGAIPELGRSGHHLQLCYSLKSIESSPGNKSWPWSLRPMSIYHQLDLESNAATWIMIKGNDTLRQRLGPIMSAIDASDRSTLAKSFVKTLNHHVINCQWASEQWRWYLNYMTTELHETAEHIKTVDVDRHLLSTMPPSRVTTFMQQEQKTRPTAKSPLQQLRLKASSIRANNNSAFVPKGTELDTFNTSPDAPIIENDKTFSFDDVQDIQSYEDSANNAKRALIHNLSVVSKIKDEYRRAWNAGRFSIETVKACGNDFEDFERCLSEVIDELKTHDANVSSFLLLLNERKRLITDMFTYQNILESKRQAQNMENLATVTLSISQQTSQDTVTMKIISWVTLLFLPATFISVCFRSKFATHVLTEAQTLLSTDIAKFTTDDEKGHPHLVFAPGALILFLALSIPLMAITIVAWRLWYRKVRNQRPEISIA